MEQEFGILYQQMCVAQLHLQYLKLVFALTNSWSTFTIYYLRMSYYNLFYLCCVTLV